LLLRYKCICNRLSYCFVIDYPSGSRSNLLPKDIQFYDAEGLIEGLIEGETDTETLGERDKETEGDLETETEVETEGDKDVDTDGLLERETEVDTDGETEVDIVRVRAL